MYDRIYTPSSARRVLGTVRPAVLLLRRIYRALEREHFESFHLDGPVSPVYFRAILAFDRSHSVLSRMGVLLRDPARGLVGFPARRAGRSVLLSWMPGDPSVAFWHEADGDPGERRRIDEDGPWDRPATGTESAG